MKQTARSYFARFDRNARVFSKSFSCHARSVQGGCVTWNNRARDTFSTKQSTGSNYHTRRTRVNRMHRAQNREEIDGRLSCWGARMQQNVR